MKTNILNYILLIISMISFVNLSEATHIAGGNITYKYVSQVNSNTYRYEITIKIFRDHHGISLSPLTQFRIYETGQQNLVIKYSKRINKMKGDTIHNIFKIETNRCSGPPPDEEFEEYIYKDTVDLEANSLGYDLVTKPMRGRNEVLNLEGGVDLPIAKLADGVYFIAIKQNSNLIATKKLIINRK